MIHKYSISLFNIILFYAIFFIDLEHGIIPDVLLITLLPFILAELCLMHMSILQNILVGFVSMLFFLILFLITLGRGMGFGDVKLSFCLGLLLGFPAAITSFYLAFLTGAVISIILVVWRKKSFKKGKIPFGPFMILGAVISLFLGSQIFQYFFTLF